VSHEGSGATIAEGSIPLQDADALDDRRRDEQPGRDIDVYAGEQRVGRQMTPNRVGRKHGQCLVRAKEDFV
jgi:hypothetical protein